MIQPGKRIDKYEFGDLIDAGGMGMVYRAHHVHLEHEVAIKVLLPNLAMNPAVRARFQQEAYVQAQLRHANSVQVTDFIETPEVLAIVMELISGPSLERAMRDEHPGPWPLDDVLQVMAPVIDVVSYAHERGVVHRDLKPANVLLERGSSQSWPGTPKVTDFGLAKILTSDIQFTATGMMMGTVPYMAPEQFRGSPDIDARSDVYALGIMLWRMLAGRRPVDPNDMGAVAMIYRGTDRIPDIIDVVPGIPGAVSRVISSSVALHPDDRPADAQQFKSRLFSALRSTGIRLPTGGAAYEVQAPAVEPDDDDEMCDTALMPNLSSQTAVTTRDTGRSDPVRPHRVTSPSHPTITDDVDFERADRNEGQTRPQDRQGRQSRGERNAGNARQGTLIESLDASRDSRHAEQWSQSGDADQDTHSSHTTPTDGADSRRPRGRLVLLFVILAIAMVAGVTLIVKSLSSGTSPSTAAPMDAPKAPDDGTGSAASTKVTEAVAGPEVAKQSERSSESGGPQTAPLAGLRPGPQDRAGSPTQGAVPGSTKPSEKATTGPSKEPDHVPDTPRSTPELGTTKGQGAGSTADPRALAAAVPQATDTVVSAASNPLRPADIKMVTVSGGRYPVGCTSGDECFEDEAPEHTVALQPFRIMEHEVTVKHYQPCVTAGACSAPKSGRQCNWRAPGKENHPVNCVTWEQAVAFCTYIGGRLPTEQEWEAAARGTDKHHFPWGNERPTCDQAAIGGCKSAATTPVGTHKEDVSWVGVFDLGGNVREWTSSDYLPYPGSPTTWSPGGKMINRGGSFAMTRSDLLTAHARGTDERKEVQADIGFRCAESIQ